MNMNAWKKGAVKRMVGSVLVVGCLVVPALASAASAPEPPAAARSQTCRDITVTYVCGTQQKCDYLKGRGTVCVEVEKSCTRTERICN